MYTFLPKPPDKALVALKERLYERLEQTKDARNTRLTVHTPARQEWERGYDEALDDEIRFLTELLDAIEKS